MPGGKTIGTESFACKKVLKHEYKLLKYNVVWTIKIIYDGLEGFRIV